MRLCALGGADCLALVAPSGGHDRLAGHDDLAYVAEVHPWALGLEDVPNLRAVELIHVTKD
eukprot:12089261-Alexandrium_andersonii.AAC.1